MLTLARAEELYENNPSLLKRAELGRFVLFDYRVKDYDLFNTHLEARDMRGIIFDKESGRVVSRPFHAFYNVGENGPLPSFHGVYGEKQDGSLAQITMYEDELVVASRGSMQGYVNERATPLVDEALQETLRRNDHLTYLFELLDPEHPIVLRHETLELVFLAARNKETGEYLLDADLPPGIRKNGYLPLTPEVWKEIVQRQETEEETEGVILICDGEYFKYKTPWYVDLHKITTDRRPADYIIAWAEDRLDDVESILKEYNRLDVLAEIQQTVSAVQEDITMVVADMRERALTKGTAKEIALELQPTTTTLEKSAFSRIMHAFRSGTLHDADGIEAEVRQMFREPSRVKKYLLDKKED